MSQSKVEHALAEANRIYGVPPEQIMSDDRSARVFVARAAVMDALRKAGWSLPRIGAAMKRHHSTVMDALRRFDRMPDQPRIDVVFRLSFRHQAARARARAESIPLPSMRGSRVI